MSSPQDSVPFLDICYIGPDFVYLACKVAAKDERVFLDDDTQCLDLPLENVGLMGEDVGVEGSLQSTGLIAMAPFLTTTSPGPAFGIGAVSTLRGYAFASVSQAALLLMVNYRLRT